MQKGIRFLLRVAAVTLLCAALGLLLLLAAHALPQERITNNVSRSAQLFAQEGTYPQLRTIGGIRMLDNYTDAWMLLHAAHSGEGHTLLDRALNVYSLELTPDKAETLVRVYGEGESPTGTHSYGRYWHGYLALLRPLLTVMGYGNIRTVNLLAQLLMTSAVAFLFLYRKKAVQALSFILCVTMLSPLCLFNSLQFSAVYDVTLAGMTAVLLKKRWTMRGLTILFTMLGCATNYFDFLTYPLAAFGLPALTLLCLEQEEDVRAQLQNLLALLIAWGCGYAGMWAAKWIIGALLGGMNILTDVLASVQLRASGVSEAGIEIDLMYTLSYTFSHYWGTPLRFIVLLIMGCCLAHAVTKRTLAQAAKRLVVMLPVCLLPVFWVIALRNHTFEHYWYAYRMFCVSVFGLLCIAAPQESVIPTEKKESEA